MNLRRNDKNMQFKYDSDDSCQSDTSSTYSEHRHRDELLVPRHKRRYSSSDRYSPSDRCGHHKSRSSKKNYGTKSSPRKRSDHHRPCSPNEHDIRRASPRDKYDCQRFSSLEAHGRRRASPRKRYDHHRSSSSSPDEHDKTRDRYDRQKSVSLDEHNKRRIKTPNRYNPEQFQLSDTNHLRYSSAHKRRHYINNLPSKSLPSKHGFSDKEDKLSPNKLDRKVNSANDEHRDSPSPVCHSLQQSSDTDRYRESASANRYDGPWDSPNGTNCINYLLNFAPCDLLSLTPTNNRGENDRTITSAGNDLPMLALKNIHSGKLKLKGGNVQTDIESGLPFSKNQHSSNNFKVCTFPLFFMHVFDIIIFFIMHQYFFSVMVAFHFCLNQAIKCILHSEGYWISYLCCTLCTLLLVYL